MPLTSVKIWQRPAPSRAARATAVVSDPPRPRVVISASCGASAPTLWPWNPATITTLPWSISRRTRAGSIPAIRALPYRPSVVIPACAPVSAIAATPSACRAIDTSVAAWCSPVASRRSSSRGSGSSVTAAASASSSSVVSPIADTTTTRSLPAVLSRAIRRATRRMRSAPATEDPPNFITTRGKGIRAILPTPSRAPGRVAALCDRFFEPVGDSWERRRALASGDVRGRDLADEDRGEVRVRVRDRRQHRRVGDPDVVETVDPERLVDDGVRVAGGADPARADAVVVRDVRREDVLLPALLRLRCHQRPVKLGQPRRRREPRDQADPVDHRPDVATIGQERRVDDRQLVGVGRRERDATPGAMVEQ